MDVFDLPWHTCLEVASDGAKPPVAPEGLQLVLGIESKGRNDGDFFSLAYFGFTVLFTSILWLFWPL